MAVVTVFLGATLSVVIAASAHFGPNPARVALGVVLEREMATARDLDKYAGASLRPNAVSTTVPLPDGSPLPTTIQLQTTALPSGGTTIAIAATATWRGAPLSLSISSTIVAPAPLPGSAIALPGVAPAPTGAP